MHGDRRRWAVPIGALVVGIALGLVLGLNIESSPDSRRPKNISTFPKTERGAVDAAGWFARIMIGPSGDADTYKSWMLDIAAPEWADQADELANNAIQLVQDRYGANGSVAFSPSLYRVAHFDGNAATVEVWGPVVGFSDGAAVDETWVTGVIEIRWVEERWAVVGEDSVEGPVPGDDAELDGFLSFPPP